MDTTLLTSRGFGRHVGLRVPPGSIAEIRELLPWWWRDEVLEPEQWWVFAADSDPRVPRY